MPPGSDDRDDSFDALMRSMGVRPMQGDAASGAKGRKGRRKGRGRKRQGRPPPSNRPSSAAASQRTPQPPPRLPSPDASGRERGSSPGVPVQASGRRAAPPPAAHPPASSASADARQLLAEIDRLRAALSQAQAGQAQLSALRAERDQAVQARQAAERTLARTRDEQRAASQVAAEAIGERDELQRSLARLGTDGQGAVPLLELLRRRGLLGSSEAQQLLVALAREHSLGPVLELLSTARPEALERFLDSRLLLLGGCPACPTLPGRVHLRLPRQRCELCHGGDLGRAIRHFYDGALVTGLTRLVIVGGAAHHHLVLRGLLDDRRVELVLVHGQLRKGAEEVQRDLASARAVVIWEGTDSDADLLEAYAAHPGPVVRVQGRDLAAFLDAAGDRLVHALD